MFRRCEGVSVGWAISKCETLKGFFNLLNIYATSRNINIALIKMVVPKSKTHSDENCLTNEFQKFQNFTSSNTSYSKLVDSSEMVEDLRFNWNDQEQGSILEQGI